MCMEVMNELGTFALLNIPSISTGIAENWIIEVIQKVLLDYLW